MTRILLNRLMVWLCGGRLWDMAQQWVAMYETKDLTGAEKHERVLAMLQEEARVIGLNLTNSLLNLAIEAAVQYVRRHPA